MIKTEEISKQIKKEITGSLLLLFLHHTIYLRITIPYRIVPIQL